MAKRVDPLKAKQKKQKIVAAVLGVALLGVLAFQIPRVLKQLNPPPTPSVSGHAAATTAAPPTGTPTLAAPTLQGAQPGPTPTPGASLLSSSAPAVQDGVLASFSRFASKDPFAPQLGESEDSSSGSGGGGSSGSGTADPGIPPIPGNEPAPGSAVISVNGTLYDVPVGTDFPQASATDATVVPLFHLVSLTGNTAKISIVGGSYANGTRTVTLKQNKPLTLMNTADGTRYTLILKPQGTGVPDEDDTSTPPTTVTLPPATP